MITFIIYVIIAFVLCSAAMKLGKWLGVRVAKVTNRRLERRGRDRNPVITNDAINAMGPTFWAMQTAIAHNDYETYAAVFNELGATQYQELSLYAMMKYHALITDPRLELDVERVLQSGGWSAAERLEH